MKKIKLKGTELLVSNICFGTGNFKERLSRDEAFTLLDCYLSAGGNFIDTANVYCRWLPDTANCAEQFLGEWLRRSGRRDQVVLATKGGHPDLRTGENRVNRQNLERELDESLQTMGVDYVDFYWLHRDNTALPMEEVIDLAERFVQAGKVRWYGASNFTLSRMKEALAWQQSHPGRGFRALSNQWSLAYPNPGYKLNGDQSLEGVDAEYYRWLCAQELPLIPYSSTAGGFYGKLGNHPLSETLERGYVNSRNLEIGELLKKLAEKYHASPVALSLAILMNQTFQVIPVTAASTPGQLEEILQAGELELEAADVEQLNQYL